MFAFLNRSTSRLSASKKSTAIASKVSLVQPEIVLETPAAEVPPADAATDASAHVEDMDTAAEVNANNGEGTSVEKEVRLVEEKVDAAQLATSSGSPAAVSSTAGAADGPDSAEKVVDNTEEVKGGEVSAQLPSTKSALDSEQAPRPSLSVEVPEALGASPATSTPSALPATSEEEDSVPSLSSPTNDIKLAPLSTPPPRRFSLQRLGALLSPTHSHESKPILDATHEASKRSDAKVALDHARIAHTKLSASDRRAKQSAHVIRALIIGPDGIVLPPSRPVVVTKGEMKKVKAQLLEPKSANRVILQLKTLPGVSVPVSDDVVKAEAEEVRASGPIHAVCFEGTDQETEDKHFSKLKAEEETALAAVAGVGIGLSAFKLSSVTTASLESLLATLKDIKLVSLLSAPDLGLGQPGDGREGEGILSGALPTAEAVIQGVEQITPQLMSLGYATGKAIIPNHAGIYPPTDRMSVLTYWWGLELVLPPPTLAYLNQNVPSISHTVMNFLTALGVVYTGVREILPFARYISQYVEFEFSAIKAQNKGKGVVCAATWIMPAAMVPRPWDFVDPPPKPDVAPISDPESPPQAPPAAPSAPISTMPVSDSTTIPGTLSPPPVAPSTPPQSPKVETGVDEGTETDPVKVDEGTATPDGKVALVEGDSSGDVPGVQLVPPTLPRGAERPDLGDEGEEKGEKSSVAVQTI